MVGRTVLIAGGAGAVGHAAIELARWSDATVIATVSGDLKADYARRAGAHLVCNYHDADVAQRIRAHAPDGVDLIVEVAAVENLELDASILATNGSIAIYASGTEPLALDIRRMMTLNARLQFVYLYTIPAEAKRRAIADIGDALEAGALGVGEERGLPLVRFALEETAEAHRAVEAGAVGKVLIDVVARSAP
jgi:NADPH2:quinone reductase